MDKILGAFFMISSLLLNCNDLSAKSKKELINDWILNNSQKIKTLEITDRKDDMNLLEEIVGDADLVCLGESRHDIHEQFQLKHRFIKYLIEEMNFTTFTLEASLPYSDELNNYILNGNGNIEEIMANMPGWFLWDTQEMKNIFNCLYEYNQTKSIYDRVNFYGIDIVAPNNALEQVFEYLQKVDKSYFIQIKDANFARNIIEDSHWPTTLQRYSRLSDLEKQTLVKNYNNLYNHLKQNEIEYIDRSSKDEFDWILLLAYSVTEANKMFSENDRIKMGLIRDQAMANITLWIKERNKKMIISAHNVHITKSEFTMNMFPENPIKGMGYILNQELEDKMISIGASFNKGHFQSENRTFDPADESSIDGNLAKSNLDYFILNLKGPVKDETIQKWLLSENVMRGQEFEMTCIPLKSYDAIYFTDNVSKIKYNQTTLEKFRK